MVTSNLCLTMFRIIYQWLCSAYSRVWSYSSGAITSPPEPVKTLNVRDDLKHLSSEQIYEVARQTSNPAVVCCLNLKGDNNLGMIIRTASNFGMSKVIILGRRNYDRRTAVGMQNYITIDRLSATTGDHSENLDLDVILGMVKEWSSRYTIVFVEQGGIGLKELTKNITSLPPLFILGSEDHGIPEPILKFQPSVRISIPQVGVGRSFNVSTAFSMVAWEYYREKL